MTLEQLNLIKESYMTKSTRPDGRTSTLGEYIKICLDGNIDFVTSKDCVVFDDSNELIHCVCINETLQTQADFPVKVISANYAVVQQLETVMSQTNFEKFLNEGFIADLISDDKKTFILNYAKSIKNQAIQPMEAEPYYIQNPTIIPLSASRIKRADGITVAEAPATESFSADYNKIIEESIKSTGSFTLNEDVTLTKALEVATDETLVLDLNGYDLTLPTTSDNYAIDVYGTMVINDSEGGGSINFNSNYAIGMNEGCSKLTINGGNFIGINTSSIIDVISGDLIINDGVFSSADVAVTTFETAGIVTVNGGIFEVYTTFSGDNITVYGGTFVDDAIDDLYIAEGYELVQTKDQFDNDLYTVTKIAPIASVNGVEYINLQEAVTAVLDTEYEVTLLSDVANGVGVIVPSEKTVTIDLGGYSYAVAYPVGSAGTETNGMQLLKDANVTIKNGTLIKNYDGSGILVQNYANLTLDGVTLDGVGSAYVLSNNNGDIILKNNTNIIAYDNNVAFDAYYWPSNSNGYGAITITTDNLTGKITGRIEVTHDNSVDDATAAENTTIAINSGTFTVQLDDAWVVEGYACTDNGDGTYTVAAIA